MDLSFLKGMEIVTDDPSLLSKAAIRKCSYTIIETYPFMVKGMRIAENGTEVYECFTLGDLVTRGLMKSSYDGPTKHGCRHYWRAEE